MIRKILRSRFVAISFVIVALVAMISAGVALRVNTRFTDLSNSNVRAFYYHRTVELIETGAFPQQDRWGFAPEIFPENTPPTLGYLTLAAHRLTDVFVEKPDIRSLANWFPVGVYIVWALGTFALVYAIRRNFLTAFLLTLLVTATPAAIGVTAYGKYFEETVGVPLVFWAVLSFISVRKLNWLFWFALADIFLLFLAWQVFPFFLGVAALLVAFNFFFGSRQASVYQLLLLIAALASGELVARALVSNAYSAGGMIYETWLGITQRDTTSFQIALSRNDWQNVRLSGFLEFFGPLGIILGLIGLSAVGAINRSSALVGGVLFALLGAGLTAEFEKMRHFSFGLFAGAWMSGASLLERQTFSELVNKLQARFSGIRWLSIGRQNVWKSMRPLVPAWLILAFVIGSSYLLWSKNIPDPVADVMVQTRPVNEDDVEVMMWLKNIGGPVSKDPLAFSGFHVAVRGGEVLEDAKFQEAGLNLRQGPGGDGLFFETKYSQLPRDAVGSIQFTVRKHEGEETQLYYRAWLPKYRCSLQQKLAGWEEMRPEWRGIKHGWRNESCMVRFPGNAETNMPFCPVRVYAAHIELQDYRCRILAL